MSKAELSRWLLVSLNAVAGLALYRFWIGHFNLADPYFVAVLLLGGYGFFTRFSPKKWHRLLYHGLFSGLYGLILITSPLGLTFALIGGVKLAVQVFVFFYLPAFLLVIWNIMQLRRQP